MQNRLKKLEELTHQLQQQIADVETNLADPELYEEAQQKKLQQLVDQRANLQQKIANTEEEWLDVMTAVESMS